MSAARDVTGSVAGPARAARALVGLDLRLLGRGAAILMVLNAGLTATVVLQYATTFSSAGNIRSLESLAQNPAIRILFGVPRGLDEAGGFTVWRIGTFAAAATAAWSLASSTRLTRGEEDHGRAWLTLSGLLHLRSALLLHLSVIAVVNLLLGMAVALAMISTGAGRDGALVYASGITAIGLIFAAAGAACAQLIGERRGATGLAAGLLLVGLLVRMVADGIEAVGWASWITPFGLLSLSAPYADDQWLPVAVLTGAAVAVGALAWAAAGHRDVGSGLVSRAGEHRTRLRLLRSPAGFATRRTLPALTGWSLALSSYFLLIGLLAGSLTEFLRENPRFAALAAQAGFADLTTVQGYAAALTMLLPIPAGLFAAARIAGLAADEAQRRLTLVLARPVDRARWVATETGVVSVATAAIAVTAALALWAGTHIVNAGLGLSESMAAALNVLPVALLSVGAAVLAYGWLPRAVMVIGALPVVGGFIIWVLADTLRWPEWVNAITPFAHLASVPAEPPDWWASGAMLAIAAGLAFAGIAGFRRRDILN